jgi:hypothetical protein
MSRRKLPTPDTLRQGVMDLLDISIDAGALAMPPMRCTCHGGPLFDCPDRPAMFPIMDEVTARAAKARLDVAVEAWVITPDEAEAIRDRMQRFLPDWRRRLREEGPE